MTPAVNNGIKHLVDYVRQPDGKSLGIAGGEYRWTNTVTVELGKVTKKPYTVYPDLSKGIAKPDPIKH